MSGTSLDGLDLAACEFELKDNTWNYKIHFAKTLPYSKDWIERLAGLHLKDAFTYVKTHEDYGHLLGILTREFMQETGFQPDLIASHGHTIFHRPDLGFTGQIGSGSAIAAETRIPVVNNFRSLDVALGGQGAPLVPIGDRLLFGNYDACLNLGGFANISMEKDGTRIAFDICPVNFVLNRLAGRLDLEFDRDGSTARNGMVNKELLSRLTELKYYSQPAPKSLGREWVEKEIDPILEEFPLEISDLLRTFTEHITLEINRSAGISNIRNILVTGGGAKNKFLMEQLVKKNSCKFHIPEPELLDFKEAMIFALLGILRYRKDINVLSSVTGSDTDHCGGSLYIL